MPFAPFVTSKSIRDTRLDPVIVIASPPPLSMTAVPTPFA
jgi:hypothetical protein